MHVHETTHLYLNNFEQQVLHHRKKFRLFPGGSYNEEVNTSEPSPADTTFNPLPRPISFALLTQIVYILQIFLRQYRNISAKDLFSQVIVWLSL